MTSLTPFTFARQSKYPTSNPATMAAVLRISLRPRRCSTAQVVRRHGLRLGAMRRALSARLQDQSEWEEQSGRADWRERRRQCLAASARPPARRALSPRDEGAADAAATMAGTEQGGQADKHDDLHNGFDRCALAVFNSNFRSSRFSEQNTRSVGVPTVQCEMTVSE